MATVCVNLYRYEMKQPRPNLRQIHNILRDRGIKKCLYMDLQNIKCSGHTMTELVCKLINEREDRHGTSSWFKPISLNENLLRPQQASERIPVLWDWSLSRRCFCRLNFSEMLRHVDWQLLPTFRNIVVPSSSGPQHPNARPWSWRH